MEKIVIFNANNESMQVDVVRYFGEGNNRYFVFSLHEIDAQGHMNIYVTKTVEQNGTMIGTNIIDDVEWSNLKTTLQRIIKENRTNGTAIVNDLPYNGLQNIKVVDRRALKLLASSVDMLNLGYNPNATVGEQTVNLEPSQTEVQNVAPVQPVQQPVQQPDATVQPVSQSPIVDTVDPQPVIQNFEQPDATTQPVSQSPIVDTVDPQPVTQNVIPSQEIPQQPIQNQPIQQPNNPSDLGIFDTPVQNASEQAPVVETNVNPEPMQNPSTENYQELYMQEKETTNRLMQENNNLVNELNNYKSIISDIQNILSRQ